MIFAGTKRILCAAALLALAACAPAPPGAGPTAQVGPVPPGEARVWFFRELEPGLGGSSPNIYVDGTSIGIVPQAAMAYRDLAPGTHVFDVDKCIGSLPSGRTLTLAAGEEAVLQVTALQNAAGWDCIPPDAYYLSPVPERMLASYRARLSFLGAR